MARLQHGPIVASASGRIGRLIIRQTRFGPVAQTAYDPPSYQTDAALAAKARFRTAQNAWSAMPATLSTPLKAMHAAQHLGVPGPWITAMITFMGGAPWEYLPATNPERELKINDIINFGAYWKVLLRHDLVYPWDTVHAVWNNPTTGFEPGRGWWTVVGSGNELLVPRRLPHHDMFLLLIPRHHPPTIAFGRGDAHFAPPL